MAHLVPILRAFAMALGAMLLVFSGLSLEWARDSEFRAVRDVHEELSGWVESRPVRDLSKRVKLPLFTARASHPSGATLAGGLGALLLGSALLIRRRGPVRDTGEGSGVIGSATRPPRKLRREVASLARGGEPLAAAELAVEYQWIDAAVRHFETADLPLRAAELLHAEGRLEEATSFYVQAEAHDVAAGLLRERGEFELAAESQIQAGNLLLAAESFLEAGRDLRAAECFAQSGFPREAAEAYAKCDRWEEAARCVEELINESGSLEQRSEAQRSKLVDLHRMAGALFRRAGLEADAQRILTRARCNAEAAQVALARGREREAANLLLDAGDAPASAEILKRLGETTEAARILAEHLRTKGELERAGGLFEEAGDLLSAAESYRTAEIHARAATCFEQCGEWEKAGEMFRQAEDLPRAADCFERAEQGFAAAECYALMGDPVGEAAMLDKAGEPLRAAKILWREKRIDEAIRVIQSVAVDHRDRLGSLALLGGIFREAGKPSLAVRKLRHALSVEEVGPDSVHAFYELAAAHDECDDVEVAGGLYERILAYDYAFADVEERLVGVRERIEAAEALPPEAAPFGRGGMSSDSGSGRYQIFETLGRGGMGVVYAARDTVLDRSVAFKVLPESFADNSRTLQNFLREAKSAARLNHPNIVTVYDAGEQNGVYYIAMEHVEGNTLKEIVDHRGPISPTGFVHVMTHMCDALAYAHDKLIVHRDIKTANTMWTKGRATKIMDFGLAKVLEELRNQTTIVSGTPYYMSPEQTLGDDVDHRTDLYSLGVTLFELATGRLPFREGNLPYHHVHTAPPNPMDMQPDLPEHIAAIILRCLEKDPGDRYQSAREIIAELRSAMGVQPPSDKAPSEEIA
ncbi:protein kinase [Myxococcota bacterium]|nr:protein kinase [Myxococcota bacterium]